METDPFSSTDVANSVSEISPDFNAGRKVPAAVRIRKNELPTGMVFDDGFAHSASEANAIRDMAIQTATLPNTGVAIPPTSMPIPLSDNWKFAVIFQPDGRATESEVRLNEQATENKILLRVRGFTGGVTIDKLERKQRNVAEMEDPLEREVELLGGTQDSPPLPTGPSSQPLDVEGER